MFFLPIIFLIFQFHFNILLHFFFVNSLNLYIFVQFRWQMTAFFAPFFIVFIFETVEMKHPRGFEQFQTLLQIGIHVVELRVFLIILRISLNVGPSLLGEWWFKRYLVCYCKLFVCDVISVNKSAEIIRLGFFDLKNFWFIILVH